MSKIEFHEITLDDKAWMDARFQEDDRNACEYTFANNFVWRKVYHVEVAEKYGCAVIRFEEEGVWEHLDYLVDKSFFLREYERAKQAKTTPHCRQQCSGCGISRAVGRSCF